ncbi:MULTISPECIES: hypothetical protein [unclassified Actinopolyspora]|uniref:hypothetical protein n=1 Tax=unclassified Actinopolyspora TaxID=2639451 RepID=UPI0013F688E4|nr:MULTISPECIES: hypothetical protein [unclassified Actinopolyspora]NHD17961.1 hypothetical protein [Actinopolyspora sp. BKK2]NHE77834.1 hypothetical protein [Actinopolyspora sp. BKK1]
MSTRPSFGAPAQVDFAGEPARGSGLMGTVLRGVSGALVAGMLVLAVTLTGVQFWGLGKGGIGPGWFIVGGHWVVALVALFLQVRADRGQSPARAFQALCAALIVLLSLAYWWWL